MNSNLKACTCGYKPDAGRVGHSWDCEIAPARVVSDLRETQKAERTRVVEEIVSMLRASADRLEALPPDACVLGRAYTPEEIAIVRGLAMQVEWMIRPPMLGGSR